MLRRFLAVNSLILLTNTGTFAQAPPVNVNVGGAPAAAGPAAAAAPAAAGGNIWSKICMTPEQHAMCKAKFCNSGAGKLINNLLMPMGAMTGGLIGPLCPPNTPNPENLKKPADSAQGAAAKIKAEEAAAKAKIADLEYLGTKNCKRYPEAEAALINALRTEKNECVRLAAARALAKGCCCTPKIMKALIITVNASTKDGNPVEESERVRATAYVALDRCTRVCAPVSDEPPESPKDDKDSKETADAASRIQGEDVLPVTYYSKIPATHFGSIYNEARMVLGRGMNISQSTLDQMNGARNVKDILSPPAGEVAKPVVAKVVKEEVVATQPSTPPPVNVLRPQVIVVSSSPSPQRTPVSTVPTQYQIARPGAVTTPVVEQERDRSLLGILKSAVR